MRYTLLILASFFPVFALAQDSLTIEEIVVTGRRFETSLMESGRNVQVLTRRQIERLPVQSFTELLQYIPGLDLRQRGAFGAQADLSLRGGGFDQTLLLLNGVKLNDPQTGHHNLNLGIDLAAIQQIEIIKGPAAARYGLNAFSGVINIITRPAAEPGGQMELTAGRAAASQLPDDFYGGYQLRGAANLHL